MRGGVTEGVATVMGKGRARLSSRAARQQVPIEEACEPFAVANGARADLEDRRDGRARMRRTIRTRASGVVRAFFRGRSPSRLLGSCRWIAPAACQVFSPDERAPWKVQLDGCGRGRGATPAIGPTIDGSWNAPARGLRRAGERAAGVPHRVAKAGHAARWRAPPACRLPGSGAARAGRGRSSRASRSARGAARRAPPPRW
jgi:hypothetical protein